jgi:hypothetical protein
MENASVVDLDSNLVSLGGSDLDVLDGQLLAGLPGDGGLAGDGLRSPWSASFVSMAVYSHFH